MSDAPIAGPKGLKATFGKKYAGIPGWAFLAVTAAGVGGYYLYKKSKKSGSGTDPASIISAALGSQGGVSNDPTSDWGASSGSGGGTVTTANGTSIASNAQWSLNAANALVADGNYSPTEISNALSKFLNGKPVTAQEQAIVNLALQKFGQPPEGILPVTPAVSGVQYYTPQPGDTLISIAAHFYGDGNAWTKIRDANLNTVGATASGGGGTLHQGMTLILPSDGLIGAALSSTPQSSIVKQQVPAGHTYTVQPGDTLITIAETFYGNADWNPIWNVNKSKVKDPNVLVPGTVLTLP